MPHVGLGVRSPIYVVWGGGIVRRSKLGGRWVRDVTELVAA